MSLQGWVRFCIVVYLENHRKSVFQIVLCQSRRRSEVFGDARFWLINLINFTQISLKSTVITFFQFSPQIFLKSNQIYPNLVNLRNKLFSKVCGCTTAFPAPTALCCAVQTHTISHAKLRRKWLLSMQGRSQRWPRGRAPQSKCCFRFRLNFSWGMPKMHYFSNKFSKKAKYWVFSTPSAP